jgi:hypothetical protein
MGAPITRSQPGQDDRRPAITTRALSLWPRLDHRRLARAHGDPRKVARLVARRTILTEEAILSLLLR